VQSPYTWTVPQIALPLGIRGSENPCYQNVLTADALKKRRTDRRKKAPPLLSLDTIRTALHFEISDSSEIAKTDENETAKKKYLCNIAYD
jgi:hypothetical protein